MSEFDKFADNYDEILNSHLKYTGADSDYFAEYRARLAVKKMLCSDIKIEKLLNFGCGTGKSEIFLSKYSPKTTLYGIDISNDSIEVAISRSLKNVNFISYNGMEIPFEDNYFDVVFVSNVFHHIPFGIHNKILLDLKQKLKPNGLFFLFEHNIINPITRKIVKECEFDKDARLLTAKYAKNLFAANYFDIESLEYIFFLPPFLGPLTKLDSMFSWLPLGGGYMLQARNIK